jgi:signal transduction histidine kinase
MKKSIAKKLIVYFLLLSLISTAIVGLYSYDKARKALIDRTFEQLISLRTEKQNRLKGFFNQRINDISSIAGLFSTENQSSSITKDKNFLKYLNGYLQASKSYTHLMLMNSDSSLITLDYSKDSQHPIESQSTPNQALIHFFEQYKNQTNPFITELHPGLNHHFSSVLVCAPYQINQQHGILLLEVSAASINNIMFENNPYNGLGKTGETYLVGKDYLMRSNSRFKKDAPYNISVKTVGVEEAFRNKTGTKKIRDYRNIPVFSSFSKVNIEGLDWVILAEIDVQEAMIPITNIRNNIIYLSVLIALFLVSIVAVLANMIAAPIKKLKLETEKVSQGIFGETIQEAREDEIGALITSFNQMTMQLKEQTERLETERMLRLSSMIDGQEIERQRLSRELHDSLGQMMLAIKMKLERALHTNFMKSRDIIQETQTLFSSIIQEVRNISNDLMPAVLNEFGLITALRNLVSEIDKNTPIEVTFSSQNTKEKYTSKTDTYLYRIAQEALNNALKYADATHIEVHFLETEKELTLEISDNGKGLDENIHWGNGIPNMKERASLIGGKLTMDNKAEGKGCRIIVTVPNSVS